MEIKNIFFYAKYERDFFYKKIKKKYKDQN